MVKSDNLPDQLGSLWNQAIVNRLVNRFKSISEGLFHVADSMQLGIMWPHDRAVIAKKLLTCVTEVTQGFRVQHARL